jgi:hypothetical protein
MTPHQNKILEKMKDKTYGEISFDFAFSLTNESERGAILIGASKVEVYLEKLLDIILPSKTKAYKSRLLNYPGPLSSFSGKIELLYAFRIIEEQVYNSLNALRKIRNEAAHTADPFSLKAASGHLEKVYNFEYGFPEAIHQVAYDGLLRWKHHIIKQNFEASELKDHDWLKTWNERYPEPLKDESIAEQFIIWKLAYGLTFLCLKIEVIADEYDFLHSSKQTWSDLIAKLT